MGHQVIKNNLPLVPIIFQKNMLKKFIRGKIKVGKFCHNFYPNNCCDTIWIFHSDQWCHKLYFVFWMPSLMIYNLVQFSGKGNASLTNLDIQNTKIYSQEITPFPQLSYPQYQTVMSDSVINPWRSLTSISMSMRSLVDFRSY